MTEERMRVLLYNAIQILEEKIFDNYETELMDILGMTKDEYCDVMDCEWYEYISDEQMRTVKQKCKELMNAGTSPKYVIGCIYGLFEDYIISEKQESELYQLVDPQELYNDVSDYWQEIDGDNELAKCIGY